MRYLASLALSLGFGAHVYADKSTSAESNKMEQVASLYTATVNTEMKLFKLVYASGYYDKFIMAEGNWKKFLQENPEFLDIYGISINYNLIENMNLSSEFVDSTNTKIKETGSFLKKKLSENTNSLLDLMQDKYPDWKDTIKKMGDATKTTGSYIYDFSMFASTQSAKAIEELQNILYGKMILPAEIIQGDGAEFYQNTAKISCVYKVGDFNLDVTAQKSEGTNATYYGVWSYGDLKNLSKKGSAFATATDPLEILTDCAFSLRLKTPFITIDPSKIKIYAGSNEYSAAAFKYSVIFYVEKWELLNYKRKEVRKGVIQKVPTVLYLRSDTINKN